MTAEFRGAIRKSVPPSCSRANFCTSSDSTNLKTASKASISSPKLRRIDVSYFTSPEQAITPIERIQHVYSSEHSQFVPAPVVESAFKCLDFLLRSNELPPYSLEYIGLKLGRDTVKTKSGICDCVSGVLKFLRKPSSRQSLDALSGDMVDRCLRCVLEILRNGKARSGMNREWPNWLTTFNPVASDFNKRNYQIRMRAEDA